ncbi:hypothetical protein PFISCL1PPCAC_9033, partial [Pristionchus fissidentatus]
PVTESVIEDMTVLKVSGKYRALACPENYKLQYFDPSKGKYVSATNITCVKPVSKSNYEWESAPGTTVHFARCAIPLCSMCTHTPRAPSPKLTTIVDKESCKLLKCEGDDGLQINNDQPFAGAAKCTFNEKDGKNFWSLGGKDYDDSAEVNCVKKKPCTANFERMCENSDAGSIKCTVENGLPVCANDQLELDGTRGNITCDEYGSGKYIF